MKSERYRLREEQRQAVRQTYDYWQSCLREKKEPRFLWNAKPRFGKTLAAYDLARKLQARRVLIVTNRPAAGDGWYRDFEKFGFNEDRLDGKVSSSKKKPKIAHKKLSLAENKSEETFSWIFTASNAAKKYLGNPKNVLTRKEQTKKPELLARNFVHFISLQDIKGRTAESFKVKNQWIFELEWDLMIVDESHEGIDTQKAAEVFAKIQRKFTLHLSGTPFRALANKSFAEEQIFSWSYPDEQKRKLEWKSAEENPYATLPQMQIWTYRLPQVLELTAEDRKREGSGYGFDLAELLRVAKIDGEERFVYAEKVKLLLKNLTKNNCPFAGAGQLKFLRHTFWLLPGIKACEQMKKLLLEDKFFGKNYTAEDIILAAGDGDNDRAVETALHEVRMRIGENPQRTRTITLSCGQLTTGVTVPAWTGVIMLNKCKSPSLYMQTAFRTQNSFAEKDSVKEKCCVYDFAPERVLEILAEMADPEVSEPSTRRRRIQDLTRYLPVWMEDEKGQMRKLQAEEILTIPLQLTTEEVVSRGFMSNKLFRNVGKVFGSPRDIREILAKLDEVNTNGEARRRHKTEIPTQAVPEWRDADESTKKVGRKKKSLEEIVRDRLRGFARTIPSFLMAYGTAQTTLANFEEGVPEGVFEELTNITKEEFRKLRDGVDMEKVNAKGRKVIEHFDGLFDAEVFNAAIQEFIAKRKKLARYFDENLEEDIFEYIPPQNNKQFFTPRTIVKRMVDKVEELQPEVFANRNNTFIDPYMKSGLFLAEIAKRIFRATRAEYDSDDECIKYILEKQVFGLAPTPILGAIAQNFLFGFDTENKISRENFQIYDITDEARRGAVKDLLEDIFQQEGEEMKFTVVIGNPPYQETVGESAVQSQSNSSWIYQYFQESADEIGKISCLIYPFGGWFDTPERLGGLGRKILSDGHTVSIEAYEATLDRRAWYRSDREPQPIFGAGANLSAGVAIVLRDLEKTYTTLSYANRIYSDEEVKTKVSDGMVLAPNPEFLKIAKKLTGEKLARRVQKSLFGIESNFVEQNPEKVSREKSDWKNPIQLLANDQAGSIGRTQIYWTDKSNIPRGEEYFAKTKVIMTSAYPKKSLASGQPTVDNVQARTKTMIEILPANSAFGASRLTLMMSDRAEECENFLKYTQTEFFAALVLQEPNQRSSIGAVIPDQDFSTKSDIDWTRNLMDINEQLCQKYKLTTKERKFLGIK